MFAVKQKPDKRFTVKFPNGAKANVSYLITFYLTLYQTGITFRPFLQELLETLYLKFEIVIFTAAHDFYADLILNYLDPEEKYFQHRLYR